MTDRNRIIIGDALERLHELESSSVDCVITSPPYFRLRDYGHTGQLGLEPAITDWVTNLRQVLGELARVLVPTGTVWLNVADSYSTHPREGAPRKSLTLGPERLALALIEDGWIVRNKIIWAKPNPMPSSVTDRLSCTHETIYLLSRQPRYYFNLDGIRERPRSRPSRPPAQPRGTRSPRSKPTGMPAAWRGPNADSDSGLQRMKRAGITSHPLGKNPGDVWHLPSSNYRGAHFATYPEALVIRMLLAGCPERRCTTCRRPHVRPTRRLGERAVRLELTPTCDCPHPSAGQGSEPGLVLDPFMGSGTTAVVAEQHDRDWLGIEINGDFATLALQRISEAGRKRTTQ